MDPKINETNITIAVINGPNMNLLGEREISHYGVETLKQIEERLYKISEQLSVKLLTFQSNHEGDIVDFIQDKKEDTGWDYYKSCCVNEKQLCGCRSSFSSRNTICGGPFVQHICTGGMAFGIHLLISGGRNNYRIQRVCLRIRVVWHIGLFENFTKLIESRKEVLQ